MPWPVGSILWKRRWLTHNIRLYVCHWFGTLFCSLHIHSPSLFLRVSAHWNEIESISLLPPIPKGIYKILLNHLKSFYNWFCFKLKSLRLSQKALGQTTIGQMVNLMSNDVNRFDFSVIFLHYLWIGPIQTLITAVILYNVIGPSCLAGLAILILFVPLQSIQL